MPNWIGHFDGYDEEGHPNRAGAGSLHEQTVHPQTTSPEIDYIGSSTAQNDNGDGTFTNEPTNSQKVVPAGATVDASGVIHI